MLLAIDIGNSSTKFGVFESESLVDKFVIPTARDYAMEELPIGRLRQINERFFQIDAAIVSSVVPEMNEPLSRSCKELLHVTPKFVDHTFDFGLKIRYEPITAVGTDRLVNAAAARAKHGCPLIVCSFGTATTIDVVSSESEYLGGTIAPGMKTLAEALHLKTSKLPLVVIEKPDSVIGSTTEESIKSGVFYGYIGMVEGIIERIFETLNERPKVVATGGFSRLVAEESSLIDVVDENLILDGLRALAVKNSIG